MSDQQPDLSQLSLLDLFRMEAQVQTQVLTDGLLAAELGNSSPARLDSLMRAAHSLKGAAAIVGLDPAVRLAHAMEDVFVAAQHGRLVLDTDCVDALLAGVDLLLRLANAPDGDAAAWLARHSGEIGAAQARIATLSLGLDAPSATQPAPAPQPVEAPAVPAETGLPRAGDALLALAGQARTHAIQLQPWIDSLHRFKRQQAAMQSLLEQLAEAVRATGDAGLTAQAALVLERALPLKETLRQRINDAENYERRARSVSTSLVDEVLALRMGRFAERVQAFPRMVRDLGRSLGKDVRLELRGQDTMVDRATLARIEAPLNQLLRNAVDHGIEAPAERTAAGKAPQGTILLKARHRGGMLQVEVADDGRGIDPERIRSVVAARGLAGEEMARELTHAELMEFLLLPGFSMKEHANEVSGRGVGLDVVHQSVRELGGSVQIRTTPAQGTRMLVTLPLTQSIVRALVVEVLGQAYALPIARVARVAKLTRAQVQTLAGGEYFLDESGAHVALVSAADVLALGTALFQDELTVIVLGSGRERYGLVVDTVLGEQSLTVQPLEPVFGKLRDVAAGALLDDGSPVLILDVADLTRSIARRLDTGKIGPVLAAGERQEQARRVLVVDDSLTVREMERKLLAASGYRVEVAIDGMDGWNMLRSGGYDLVVTDVDMPRMDGIGLVELIRRDPRLYSLPVVIVSYKDSDEHRARGLQAGADLYLAKGSFHDTALLDAVASLIGGPLP